MKQACLFLIMMLIVISPVWSGDRSLEARDVSAAQIVPTQDIVRDDTTVAAVRPQAAAPDAASLHWSVLASGGGRSTLGTLYLGSTLGQTAAGTVSLGGHFLIAGFWQNFTTLACCLGLRGNANSDDEEVVNVSDIVFVIDYLFGEPRGPAPECRTEGNANGDIEEAINVTDIVYLIDYLFGIPLGPAPVACP